jgi:hypothetical protein
LLTGIQIAEQVALGDLELLFQVGVLPQQSRLTLKPALQLGDLVLGGADRVAVLIQG